MAGEKNKKGSGEEQTHWVNFPRELVHPYKRTRNGKEREMASVEMPAGTQIFKVDLSGMKLQLRLTELQKEHLVNGDQPYVRFPLDPGNVTLWDPNEKREIPTPSGALAKAVREAIEKAEKARAEGKAPKKPKRQKAKPYWSLDPCTEKQIATIINARDNGDLTEKELREASGFGDMSKGEASALITLASKRKKVREEYGDAGRPNEMATAPFPADEDYSELDDEGGWDPAADLDPAYDGESPEYFDRIYEENLAAFENSYESGENEPSSAVANAPSPLPDDEPPLEAYGDIDAMYADEPEEAPLQVGYVGMSEQRASAKGGMKPGKPAMPARETGRPASTEGLLWAEDGELLRKSPR